MKIKVFLACIIILLSAAATQANSGVKVSPGYDSVIKDFMESHMKSDHKKLNAILNYDASIKIPRGEQVIVQNKMSTVEQMKENAGTQQNCECSYEVLGKSDAIVIARVDFKYGNCVQHNYLTIEKDQDKEWKITQDCKIFDDIRYSDAGGAVTAKS
jgi:hypothetical protein